MAAKPKKAKQHTGRAGRVAFAALVIAAVLALAFFLVLRTQDQTSIAENAIGTVLSPIQAAFSSTTLYVRDLFSGVRDYFRMSEDLESLKRERDELRLQLSEYQEAAVENERLKGMLEVKERYEQLAPLYARVISRDPGIYFETFAINKGTIDGVSLNMAVMTSEGLVGLVSEVGLTYAKVTTIIDSRSSVGCIVASARVGGIMRGSTVTDGGEPVCRIDLLPAINAIMPGDTVSTSGADNVFPKGIKIGEVAQVSRQQSDTSDRFVLVRPSANFQNIEEVFVLMTPVERVDDRPQPTPIVPTPKPVQETEPTPEPTPDPSQIGTDMEAPWQYPTGQLTEDGLVIEDEPLQQYDGQTEPDNQLLPEDIWAE